MGVLKNGMTIEDIKRLNYIKYTAFRDHVPDSHCILFQLLKSFVSNVILVFRRHERLSPLKELLFVVPTINNRKSIKTILEELPEDRYTIWGNGFSAGFPRLRMLTFFIKYLYLALWLYFKSSTEDRKLIRYFYNDFFYACAIYKVLEGILLNAPKLKMVILANDHALIQRVLIELTEKYHIKSLYVQHASVTTSFPPLRFDYSFLDGLESYEKYKFVGNMRGQVFLTGSPRFDAFHNYKKREKRYDIGIALNALDSEDLALELCLFLKERYSDRIIVRPHPAMLEPSNPLFHFEKFTVHGFEISNPQKDLSYVFLSEIKVMIANESSIHLDSALMGVPSLLYNFSNNNIMDWYSYLKIGLIKQCDTFDEVIKMLDSGYQVSVDLARYYAASFRTSHDGKVGEMIATFIKKFIFESEKSAFDYIDSQMITGKEFSTYRN